MPDFRTKRIYDAPSESDGKRVLVDRLWPRGVKKEDAKLDDWLKDAAPSNDLRKRYHADGDWRAFWKDYEAELEQEPARTAARSLLEENGTVTLLYSSKQETQNNAHALKAWLETQ